MEWELDNNVDKVTVAENIEYKGIKVKIEIDNSKIDINKVQEHIYKMILHEHVWEPVKNSPDVKCKICGIRAMRGYMEVRKCK